MSRNNGSIVDLLFLFPWWLNAALTPTSYIFLKYHLPTITFETAIGKGIAGGLSSMGGFISGGIALIALIQFIKFIHRKSLIPRISGVGFLSRLFSSKDKSELENLRKLSWREFEILACEIYRQLGYQVFETSSGADGGVDLTLKKDGEVTLVQCKHWRTKKIGVKTIRELYGVMISENANKAVVMCSGSYTNDAYSFAANKPISMIEGQTLLAMINTANKPQNQITPNKPLTPQEKTCKRCGSNMIVRTAKQGVNAGNKFWGCTSFPRCRNIEDLS